MEDRGWLRQAVDDVVRDGARPRRRRRRRASCGSPPTRSCPGWRGPPTRSTRRCTRSTAATCRPARAGRRCAAWSTCCRPAATSTPSTPRPIPVPAGLGDRPGDGRLAARALPRRHRRVPALGRACRSGARRAMRTAGDDIAEVLALLGVRPVVGRRLAAGRPGWSRSRSTSWAGPGSTSPCASRGFFRDAFPHVVAMLDDAVPLVAGLDEPTTRTTCARTRRPTSPGTATGGGPRPGSSAPSRARTAPGCCR